MNDKIYFHIDNQDFLPVGIKFDKIHNIDNYTNNSIEHIFIQDLLDYYADSDSNNILLGLKDKLITNGLITIQSTDIKQLCVAVAFGDISIDIAKNILYPNKKSIKSIYDINNLLINNGFEIEIKKYINIFEYYIVAKKI